MDFYFKSLTELEHLKFRSTHIFPKDIYLRSQRKLIHLDLSDNGLDSIPNEIFENKNGLKKILLSNNYLKFLPESIKDLQKLETLILDRNYLQVVESLSNVNLKVLDISNSLISPGLSYNISVASTLKELRLCGLNNMKIAERFLENQSNLTNLFIESNPCSHGYPNISKNIIQQLEYLSLNTICLADLTQFETATELTSLKLTIQYNEETTWITQENFTMETFSKLKFFNLKIKNYYNRPYAEISKALFEKLYFLEEVTFYSLNSFDMSASLGHLKLLKHVTLDKIRKFSVGNMTEFHSKLITLSVTGSAIQDLKIDSFVNQNDLVHLDLSSNAIKTLPEPIFQNLKKM